MRSQTLEQLRLLFRLLPPQRLSAVQRLLPLSVVVCMFILTRMQ